MDFIVEKGGGYTAIEVETGGRLRNADQLAKDASMELNGARIGHNGGELENRTMKLKTVEMRPF